MINIKEVFHQIAVRFAELGILFEELSKGEEEAPPSDDPPSDGPLSDEERRIILRVFNTNDGIQIAKQNPKKFPGPIAIEFEKDHLKNGYGKTLVEAFEIYSGPIANEVGIDFMEVGEQLDWRVFLDTVPHPTAVRKSGDGRFHADFFRKSLLPETHRERPTRAKAVEEATNLPDK